MTDIVERLREQIDPDHPNLWKVDKDRVEAADEIERLRGVLAEALITLRHAEVFIGSSEQMHSDGQALYRESVEQISLALGSKP